LSDCEVDDVAATAAGVTGLRAAGTACWRVAGAKAGAGKACAGKACAGEACAGAACVGEAGTIWVGATAAVLTAAAAGVVLGTALRAIGRGFGSGTFGLAQASTDMADSPTASARPVASAVDRHAAARAEDFTAFLCGGESFDP